VNLRKRKRNRDQVVRSVYLLPNLFTTANLFCGLLAIQYSIKAVDTGIPDGAVINPYFVYAAVSLCAAVFFDGIDGLAATLTNTTSKFGMQYDSLADLVSFGVAPGVMLYTMFLPEINKRGVAVVAFLAICTAMRLARYNVQASGVEKGDFLGLPSPAPASVLASMVLFLHRFEIPIDTDSAIMRICFFMTTVLLSLLMVSNVRYANPKRPSVVQARRPLLYLVVFILVLAVTIQTLHEGTFLILAIAYVAYGLVFHMLGSVRKKSLAAKKEQEDTESNTDNTAQSTVPPSQSL
jgi:CDP-diacylglycerol---serine O-phosphatidyltransferase